MTIASKNIASKKAATIKALLLVASLVATTPGAVRADPPDPTAFLAANYMQCSVYYLVIADCMGDQRGKYVETAEKLWTRAVNAALASGSSKEAISQNVSTIRDDMFKQTGGKCAKADVLHKTYRKLCQNTYDGK